MTDTSGFYAADGSGGSKAVFGPGWMLAQGMPDAHGFVWQATAQAAQLAASTAASTNPQADTATYIAAILSVGVTPAIPAAVRTSLQAMGMDWVVLGKVGTTAYILYALAPIDQLAAIKTTLAPYAVQILGWWEQVDSSWGNLNAALFKSTLGI